MGQYLCGKVKICSIFCPKMLTKFFLQSAASFSGQFTLEFKNQRLSILTLSILTPSILTLSLLTISILTISILTISIMTLSIMTLSIMTLSIMISCRCNLGNDKNWLERNLYFD
jgi:hypothetical protein